MVLIWSPEFDIKCRYYNEEDLIAFPLTSLERMILRYEK